MYKLIFVDDEIRTIEALSKVIPWEELNIRIIGIFDSGVEALQLIVDERPDILVTDLVMPVMGGLELITRAKEMYPSLECMVLSGYEEFELARGAIACGAREYLVKPCQKEALVQGLKKCVKNLEENCNRTAEDYSQRQSKIEELYEQLMMRCKSNSNLQSHDVEELIVDNVDYGMLKDATIIAVVQNESSAQRAKEVLKELPQKRSKDEIIRCVVDVFNGLSLQKQPADAMVQKIIEYVSENYAIQSLNLQHIADKVVFLSSGYIGKRFMATMDMKFSDYLLQIRIDKAIELFEQSKKMSAAEVAEKVGLGNNVQYFYRLFRRRTGVTVREFKNQVSREEAYEDN